VLDVNQGGLICRCQSLQAFIPISQLNRERDTWLSPEVSCCAVLCCAVLCCAVLCCAVLCCAALRCAVLCCAVLCCAVLRCAVLCCAVLHWLRLLALPCHFLVHNSLERVTSDLSHLLPIFHARYKETCCFSCIPSTQLNKECITWLSLEIIYSACCAVLAMLCMLCQLCRLCFSTQGLEG